jgi:hypothetical protein
MPVNHTLELAFMSAGGHSSGVLGDNARFQGWPMKNFIHEENLRLFRKSIAETSDPAKRQLLLKLLADEEAKGDGHSSSKEPKLP